MSDTDGRCSARQYPSSCSQCIPSPHHQIILRLAYHYCRLLIEIRVNILTELSSRTIMSLEAPQNVHRLVGHAIELEQWFKQPIWKKISTKGDRNTLNSLLINFSILLKLRGKPMSNNLFSTTSIDFFLRGETEEIEIVKTFIVRVFSIKEIL